MLGVTVSGASDSVSADLLAGWLALRLRCPVKRVKVDRAGTGLRAVALERRSGTISLVRPEGATATLTVSNQPPRQLSLPRRILRDCIAEELRRLDADEVYADVLARGLKLITRGESEKPVAEKSPPAAASASAGRTPAAAPRTRTAAPRKPRTSSAKSGAPAVSAAVTSESSPTGGPAGAGASKRTRKAASRGASTRDAG